MFDLESAVARSVLHPLKVIESRLDEALYSGHGYKIVAHSLDELDRYAQFHLRGLFYQPGAEPCAAPPSRLYQQFADQVREWLREYKDGANVLSGEILHFLRGWLNSYNHLVESHQRPDQLAAIAA